MYTGNLSLGTRFFPIEQELILWWRIVPTQSRDFRLLGSDQGKEPISPLSHPQVYYASA
jgi:hypothetical protein